MSEIIPKTLEKLSGVRLAGLAYCKRQRSTQYAVGTSTYVLKKWLPADTSSYKGYIGPFHILPAQKIVLGLFE